VGIKGDESLLVAYLFLYFLMIGLFIFIFIQSRKKRLHDLRSQFNNLIKINQKYKILPDSYIIELKRAVGYVRRKKRGDASKERSPEEYGNI